MSHRVVGRAYVFAQSGDQALAHGQVLMRDGFLRVRRPVRIREDARPYFNEQGVLLYEVEIVVDDWAQYADVECP